MNIILGNITSFLANILDAYSSTRKTKKEMMKIQCIGCIVYTVSNTLFNAYSTVVQNLCAFLRNILAVKEVQSKIIQYIIVLAGIILGIYFNNLGLLGLLPVFANAEYSICLFVIKNNVRALKYSFLICNICFIILNFFIKNYVGLIFTSITVITTIINLIKKPLQWIRLLL